MRRTKEDAEQTRQALLDAALKVFSREGYAATRLEDIAEAAGVTRGAIYHHFGSKPELFAQLVEEAEQTGNQAVGRAIQEGGSFAEITRRVLVYTLQLLQDDARFREVMALVLFNSGDSPELSRLWALRNEQITGQLGQIAGFFEQGIAQGAVRADLDPKVAARAFVAYQNGLVSLALMTPGSADIAKQAGPLADVFVCGIEP